MLALPEGDAATLFDYFPLNPGLPVELEGRRFEAIYAIHSIPTIAVRVNGVCYSGDMRYDEEWFGELELRGVLSAERREELMRFADGATVLVQDVGGGSIHSTITPRLLQALTAKSQRLVLAHTSKHLLPAESDNLAGQIEFADSGHVVGLGGLLPDDQRLEIAETIAACPLFSRLSVGRRMNLALLAEVIDWEAGEAIMHEGDASDGHAYIVHSGLVEIWIAGEQVRVLARGSSIGERGAILGNQRTSTMQARGHVQLVRFDPATFQELADQLGLAQAFARAEWLWQIPVLRDLPWASLLDLALDFQPRQLAAGELLFSYGDPGYEGYLLVSGGVDFNDASGMALGTLSDPGQFFGGRSALYGTPRSASARASSLCEIWELSAPAIQRLNLLYPNILLHLRAVEAGHLRSRGRPVPPAI
jgi:CRP-like cAMP-binding protein